MTATTLILLFYTHLLGFCTAALILVLSAPVVIRRDSAGFRKLTVLFALVGIGTLPWIVATGFYKQQGRIPRAWTLLKLPGDLLRYPPVQWDVALLGSLAALATAWLVFTKHPVSERILEPVRHLSPVLLFLGLWTAAGYVLFIAFIPAVSFDVNRLNLSYWGPAFLLASAACAALARVISPKRSMVWAPVILLSICLCLGRRPNYLESPTHDYWAADSELFNYLGAAHLNSETKIYASPNDHLILTFYSGLPIQDITPVRKSYLDTYPGEIVYIDRAISVNTGVLDPEGILKAARQHGYRMCADDARDLSIRLRTIDYRRSMLSTLYPAGLSQLERPSRLGRKLLAAQHRKIESVFSDSSLELVTRGYIVKSWSDWRVLLKYRFTEPKAHSGGLANYADRLRDADTLILVKADAAVYRSRWHPLDSGRPLTFQFIR